MINSNTNRVYLSKVHIQDFRAFGKSDISLHAGPSIVLLVGPNGIGKSSWFEAIEMALAGDVRRWQKPPINEIPPTAQIRRGSVSKQWSIDLTFQQPRDDQLQTVSRSGPSPIIGTSVDQVIHRVLALDPDVWALTKFNLLSFLHATHILSQSSQLRFFSKTPRERWDEILSQVSGFARMLRASHNIGQGTKQQLTIMENKHQDQASDAEEELRAWRDLRMLYDDAERRRANRLETIDPEHARISLELMHITIPLPPSQPSAKDDAVAILSTLRGIRDVILIRQSEIAARIKNCEDLRGVPVEMTQILTLHSEASRRIDATQTAFDGAEIARATIEAEKAERVLALAEAQKQADRTRNVLEGIAGLRAIRLEIAAATEAEREHEAAMAGAVASISETEMLLKTVDERRQRRATWEAQGDSFQRRRTQINEANLRLDQIVALLEKLQAVDQKLRETSAFLVIHQREREDIAAKAVAQETKARAAETAVQESLARNDAIKNAIAAIATYLHPDAVSCPVCSQEWKPAGTLLAKAKVAAAAFEPNLTSIENESKQAKTELDRLRLELDRVNGRITELSASLKQLETDAISHRADIQHLLQFSFFLGHDQTTLRAHIQEIAEQLTLEEVAWTSAFENSLPPVSEQDIEIIGVRGRLHQAREYLVDTTRKREQAHEARAVVEAQAIALLTRIHELDASVDGTEDDRVRYEQMRLSLDQHVLNQSNQLSESERRLAAAVASVEAHRQELVKARTHIAELDARSAALKARWVQSSLAEPVTSDVLESALAELLTQHQDIEQDRNVVERVALALSHWLEDQETAQIRERLIAQSKGDTPEAFAAHETRLADEVKRRSALLDRTRRVRRMVEILSSRLGEDAAELRKSISTALKEPIGRLLPTLVQDRNFHKLHLEIEGSSQRAEVGAALGENVESQAEHFLSEGQMAGVSLAVLLAMATTFRWSRWPALILDDPTQHNDLIHATNLIEMLRTLVFTEGFQVLMSTHDREFAEFVQKKFKNARIPGTLLRFRDAADGKGVIPVPISWE